MENEQTQNANQIDLVLLLHDMIRGMLKFWWLLIILVIGFAAGYLGLQYKRYVPMYQSKASFTVSMEGNADSGYDYLFYYDRSTAAQMASTFPYILESELLTDLVKQDLDVDYINGSISASAIENSNLFTLAVTSRSPEDAKKILDSVIKNYPIVSQYVIGHTQLNMIEAGQVPTEPYNHIARRNAAMKGGMLGGIIWLGLILLYAYFRETIKSEEQIRTKLNAVCLGTIPMIRFKERKSKTVQEITIRNKRIPESFSESIRKLSLRLSKTLQDKDGKVLAIVGTNEGEGCSMTSLNLAYSIAEMSKKVLLIRQEKENSSAIYQPLEISDDDKKIGVISNLHSISVVSVPNKFKDLTLDKKEVSFESFLSKQKQEFDCIIIDAGLGSILSEAASAIQYADLFALVLRQDATPHNKIANIIGQLSEYNAEFAGCILNGVSGGLLGYGYGKYGGYHYASYGYGYGHYGKKYGYGKYGYGYGYGHRYGYGSPQKTDIDTDGKSDD